MKGTWRGKAIGRGPTTRPKMLEHRCPDRYCGGVRPLIGISSYARGGQRRVFSVPCEYVDAVRTAGGIPVVLPPVLGPVYEALSVISGLILPGGGDIHPEHYGGSEHEATYGVCHERDH